MNAALAALAESGETLPDIAQVQATIQLLLDAGAVETLDEARRRAEAYSLYEKHAGHQARAEHYCRLRLLTEAALGALSYDEPNVIESFNRRLEWRSLAVAFERGKLLSVCDALAQDGGSLSTSRVVWEIRSRGYTYVPGDALGSKTKSVPWSKARVLAREQDIPLASLPIDKAVLERRNANAREAGYRMQRMYDAKDRLERMQLRQAVVAAAKERGPGIDTGYALLRRTLQALHEAQTELRDPVARRALDGAIQKLYIAEDYIAEALGLRAPDYR